MVGRLAYQLMCRRNFPSEILGVRGWEHCLDAAEVRSNRSIRLNKSTEWPSAFAMKAQIWESAS